MKFRRTTPGIALPFGLYLAVTVVLPFISGAAEQCFCLAHPVTGGVVHYGCEAHTIPNRVSERVACLAADRATRIVVGDAAGLLRLPGGEGLCDPCAPPPDPRLPEIPRQPDQVEPNE